MNVRRLLLSLAPGLLAAAAAAQPRPRIPPQAGLPVPQPGHSVHTQPQYTFLDIDGDHRPDLVAGTRVDEECWYCWNNWFYTSICNLTNSPLTAAIPQASLAGTILPGRCITGCVKGGPSILCDTGALQSGAASTPMNVYRGGWVLLEPLAHLIKAIKATRKTGERFPSAALAGFYDERGEWILQARLLVETRLVCHDWGSWEYTYTMESRIPAPTEVVLLGANPQSILLAPNERREWTVRSSLAPDPTHGYVHTESGFFPIQVFVPRWIVLENPPPPHLLGAQTRLLLIDPRSRHG